ncbi:TPA: sugar phosphate nucleotidyltransferase, partial [Escherichia coli]
MIIPIIMAGGSGTRLWPLSRSFYPKQFLELFSEDSLIQGTL